jgi:cellulose synthase/poly-beta-1,6-N-acetylglucosamine synthase-like glycosyltransferase
MGPLIVALYTLSMLFILAFSLGQLHLTWLYRKSRKNKTVRNDEYSPDVLWPNVTIQLPVYNEKYVIERLIDAVTLFDYPKNLLHIQVLDDSNDETVEIIAGKVAEKKSEGYDIEQIRRPVRQGFKAGALQYGLKQTNNEFLAIFDADFIPEKDFLKRTLPWFSDQNIGMVQTRWGHLNKNFSLLTRLQAFGLDGHFSVEQSARNHAGSFINFNGTAGIWRKACIESAGGWQSDTLTEDLDLSYRAQMKGWKFKYLEKVESPAELPIAMSALKSQQFRWTKGGAETARKMLPQVFRTKMNFMHKIHAILHLSNSTSFLFLLLASVLSVPMLLIKQLEPALNLYFQFSSLFILGFLAMTYFYWTSTRSKEVKSGKVFAKYFPLYVTFSMGMALHNSVAVLEGLLGMKSAFIRTPKFNVVGSGAVLKSNIYLQQRIQWINFVELLLFVYFAYGVYLGLSTGDYGLLPFHLMLALGYGGVFYYSIKK